MGIFPPCDWRIWWEHFFYVTDWRENKLVTGTVSPPPWFLPNSNWNLLDFCQIVTSLTRETCCHHHSNWTNHKDDDNQGKNDDDYGEGCSRWGFPILLLLLIIESCIPKWIPSDQRWARLSRVPPSSPFQIRLQSLIVNTEIYRDIQRLRRLPMWTTLCHIIIETGVMGISPLNK